MNEQKNLMLAIALSFGALLVYNHFIEEKPKVPTEQSQTVKAPEKLEEAKPEADVVVERPQALSASPRIKIDAPKLHGSINLVGARFDDIALAEYHETTDKDSPEIKLLSPKKTQHPYFVEFGWINTTGVAVPTAETVWKSSDTVLSVDKPVKMTWDNGHGVLFERTITVDDNYVFEIKDKVTNHTSQAVKLNSYGQINRIGTPQTGGFMILHEGPIGVLNGKLVEVDYSKLKEKGSEDQSSKGGWLGITDKYWLVSLIPNQETTNHTRFKEQTVGGVDRYQTEAISPEMDVAAGASVEVKQHLFTGAKVLHTLDHYEQKLGVEKFHLAVDFGWFYFLTKPLFYLLSILNKVLGNFGLAILVMTILFKLALFPLANGSYRSMSRMKKLQPKLEALKQRYENDKVRLNQEMMELYKKEKINPLAGCLPILIQAPIFFCLYKVLFVTIEMRQAPFYGWIHDLSAPDPTTFLNLFGLFNLPFTAPSFLMIGAWPLIMGLTMLLQQKLNPQPVDPAQAKAFMIMPVLMTFLFASFPAGLVIYWAWSNLLSIVQQWWIMRLEAKRAGA